MKNNTVKKDVYDIVTERILAELEKGTIPWQKPWTVDAMPKNLATKKEYRGINVVILGIQPYGSPYWLTMKQINNMGGRINKGESPTPVIFWKYLERKVKTENADGTIDEEIETIPILRYYKVWNVEQTIITDYPKNEVNKNIDVIKKAEKILKGYKNAPVIKLNGNSAYYSPKVDEIHIPDKKNFKDNESYYATLFHELTHSTGHQSRLNRPEIVKFDGFGQEMYSREELIAEAGASFLCGLAGISNITITNSASYIQNWITVLKNNKRILVQAFGRAQKAVDYITNKKFDKTFKK